MLQLLAMCYFGNTMIATISNEGDVARKNFLGRFILAGLAWFVVVPVTVFIGASVRVLRGAAGRAGLGWGGRGGG